RLPRAQMELPYSSVSSSSSSSSSISSPSSSSSSSSNSSSSSYSSSGSVRSPAGISSPNLRLLSITVLQSSNSVSVPLNNRARTITSFGIQFNILFALIFFAVWTSAELSVNPNGKKCGNG